MGSAPKASILLGRGKTLVSMGNVAVGAVTNIVLDALFINGFPMGVQGATLTTILSQGVSAGFVIRYLCTGKSVLRLRLRNIRSHGKLLWPCILLGTSPALMLMCDKVTHKNLIDSSPLFREKIVYNLEQQGGVISNPSRKLVPQLHIDSNTGMILFPKAVSE